jgi:hypothetical protein
MDRDVPHATSYGVYISQLIWFAFACSKVNDFNKWNIFITGKLLTQGYRYYRLRKYFTKFYNRNFDLILKFNSDLKTLLRQGISQSEFYRDVVYKPRKILGHCNFSIVFTKIIKRFIKRLYGPSFLSKPHAYWSTHLQFDATLSSFDYIWRTMWETLWWTVLKTLWDLVALMFVFCLASSGPCRWLSCCSVFL